MSLLLSQLSAGGSIKEGAAALASVSAWNAAAGAVRPGAADILISSEWSATGAMTEVPTNGGGGGWSGRPVLRRIGKVKSAYAELRISSDWSASASPIRGVGMSIEEAMLILSLID
jgi:hypothetical protein